MNFRCPKCKETLEARRPKVKVCPGCGSWVPTSIILKQWGAAVLNKEEAKAIERQKAGKSLSSLQCRIAKLRSLDPEGAEFYSVAAGYFRKRFRPNRTYGVFFILLGSLPVLLAIREGAGVLKMVFLVGAYLIFGALGLILFYNSAGTLKNLPESPEGQDCSRRLQGLREIAESNLQDPVAALVLELAEEKQNDPVSDQK